MSDLPIPFSAPMVRALIDGRKTKTRRAITPANFKLLGHDFRFHRPDAEHLSVAFNGARGFRWIEGVLSWLADPDARLHPHAVAVDCRGKPQFAPGDRLWVREHWRTESSYYDDFAPSEMGGEETIIYAADADWALNMTVGRHRHGMFMPRWASRLTLIVTDVRVERLQDISEDDAAAEGVCSFVESLDRSGAWAGLSSEHRLGLVRDAYGSCRQAFWHLWDTINGPGAWEANPWVTVTSFEVRRQNIDNFEVAA